VLQLTTGQIAVVKEIKNDSVVLDGNHPLAGKTLNFEVTVNYVVERTQVLCVEEDACVMCGGGCIC